MNAKVGESLPYNYFCPPLSLWAEYPQWNMRFERAALGAPWLRVK